MSSAPPRIRVAMTPTKKARIWHEYRHGNHNKASIARKLNLDRSSVSRTLKSLLAQGRNRPDFYARKPKSGRPRKFSDREGRIATRAILMGKAYDATDLQRKFYPYVHPSTVRRVLYRNGLRAYVRRKKPYLSRAQVGKRKKWARALWKKDRIWWRRVWFSDESKFSIYGSDGRHWCWAWPGEQLQRRTVNPVVKYGGGSVMVWGVITPDGVGEIARVEGTLDAKQYTEILQEHLLSTISEQGPLSGRLLYVQDNDPKHTSRRAKAWFKRQNITLLPWPPSSPDMNIIEPVWDYVDKRIRRRKVPPRNREELWEAIQEEWYKVPSAYIETLYNSIPSRVLALKRSKGWYTKY